MTRKIRKVQGMASDGSYERFFDVMMANKVARNAYEEAKAKQRVAWLISDMRTFAGLTQGELAARLNVSDLAIVALEEGDTARAPSFALISRVAKACDVELRVGYMAPDNPTISPRVQQRKRSARKDNTQTSAVMEKVVLPVGNTGAVSGVESFRYVEF